MLKQEKSASFILKAGHVGICRVQGGRSLFPSGSNSLPNPAAPNFYHGLGLGLDFMPGWIVAMHSAHVLILLAVVIVTLLAIRGARDW